MMTREELTGSVRQWVSTHKLLDQNGIELTDDTDLIATGLLDSFDFVQLLAFSEGLIGGQVDLVDIDVETFTTLGGFCAHLAGQSQSFTPSA